jgi:hypothetical protein
MSNIFDSEPMGGDGPNKGVGDSGGEPEAGAELSADEGRGLQGDEAQEKGGHPMDPSE